MRRSAHFTPLFFRRQLCYYDIEMELKSEQGRTPEKWRGGTELPFTNQTVKGTHPQSLPGLGIRLEVLGLSLWAVWPRPHICEGLILSLLKYH